MIKTLFRKLRKHESPQKPWIHITPGPTFVLKSEYAGWKWCFQCRKRLKHTAELMADYPLGSKEMSYYDPVWVLRCSGCGGDHTRFPH